MRKDVLLFVIKDGKILLGHKKRGLGEGKWNGAGGKVEAGESFIQAAVRETEEEFGITPLEPVMVATLRFDVIFQGEALKLDVRVFTSTDWHGEPQETDEMKPVWFKLSEIPFENMWQDDIHWLPLVLQGKKVKAKFTFDENNAILSQEVTEIASL